MTIDMSKIIEPRFLHYLCIIKETIQKYTRRIFTFVSAGLFTLLLCSACTVTDYKNPIADLRSALDTSKKGVETLDGRLTKAQNTKRANALTVFKPGGNYLEQNGCTQKSDHCRLVIQGPICAKIQSHNSKAPCPDYPSKSALPDLHRAMAGLTEYVAKLQAIVALDTASKITTSANSTLASIKEFAVATSQPDAAKKIGAFAAPTEAAIGWLVGLYVDTVRMRALRKAVTEMQPVVNGLSEYAELANLISSNLEINTAIKSFNEADQNYTKAKLSETVTEAIISKYVDSAQKLDNVLRLKAANPIGHFQVAHTKLHDQITGKSVTLLQIIEAVQTFATKAKEFKSLVDKFEEAAK